MRGKHFLSFILLFFFCIQLQAQERTITGKVISGDDQQPLPGVSIVIKGTTLGTTTDINGKYLISFSGENQTLVFSFVGYLTQEIQVGSGMVIDVTMMTDVKSLDEVVVVGYGVQKKSLVTGAISKIGNEEISKGTNLRINQALQGKTAGVLIMNNSGQPGDGVSVRVRGTGTNGSADPLYIVDGLPLDGNGIDFLNPSDIESMEVLKDAASSAIYGARGANGVVLITTKQGNKNGRMQVSYDAYYGVQNPWRKLDMVNSKEYMMLINEASVNDGKSPFFSQTTIDTLKYNTDWQDEMFNYNAPIQNHVLSVNGGNEKSTYSSSFSYFGQQGIVAKGKSNFERITYRLNNTRSLGLLTLGSNINYANIKNRGISANDQYSGNSLIQALNTPPIVPVKMPDGSWGTPEKLGLGLQEITNPIAMLSYNNSETVTNKVIGGVYGEFDLSKISKVFRGLKFRSSYGMELTYVNYRSYTPQYILDATHQTTINRVQKSVNKYSKWNIENVLTYDKTINKHHFTLMAGHAAFKDWHESIDGNKTDVIFDDLGHAYLDNALNPNASLGGTYDEHTVLSYFGRVNYEFSEKYLLTGIIRRDGSSRFGPSNKFGNFPSVSAGWILSKESFMDFLSPKVNFMKLRASWGQNGNENIGNFRYTSIISNGAIYYFGTNQDQYNGTQPSRLANPLLKWEASEQTDIGLDMGMFDNRITFTADYYIKSTKDWLVDIPAPWLVGNTPPLVNGGDVRNKGVEFELGLKHSISDFHFDLTLTGGYNVNEVTKINNQDKRLTGGTGGHGMDGILVAEVGKPLGYFKGYKTGGVFQNTTEINAYVDGDGNKIQPNAQPGDLKFLDLNGDGKLDDNDKVEIGNPYPDFTGGINLNADFKGFDLSMFWYTALGHQIWDATRRFDLGFTNFRGEALNRWVGEGTSTSYPRMTLADNNGTYKTPSDFYVHDADYIRLKNISLGYTIPSKLTRSIKIEKLRVYVAADNLLTFTKYKGFEPEIGGGPLGNGIDHGVYPQARTIYAGLNVSF